MTRSLSLPLLQECNQLFERCSQFSSDQALSAMFVTPELIPFASGLPSGAPSKNERISRCLAYLLSQTSNNQSVLIPFISQLQDRFTEGNDLRNLLGSLLGKVTAELTKSDPISTKQNLPTPDAQDLRKYLEKRFALGELEALIFDLSKSLQKLNLLGEDESLDSGNVLVGSSKTTQIINMIQYMERRGWYQALVEEVRKTDQARQFPI